MDKAVYVAINEKSRYVSERIARTEAAKAWADGFYSQALQNPNVVGFRWKTGSRHPVFDICDVYANADMFNMGKGIYPKDKVPPLPAHPHCLCRLYEVYKTEVALSKVKDNTDKEVSEWVKGLNDRQRQDVLGVKGADEFGKTGKWQGNLRGWQSPTNPTTRLKPEFVKNLMEQNLFPPSDNFIKELANRQGLSYTVGKQGVDRFYADDGKPIYPPNDGFVGSPKIETLTKGSVIDRYGDANGSFVSPKGTKVGERALPIKSRNDAYRMYRIGKNVENVLSGRTAAWFDESGGGWQHKLPDKIFKLTEYLKEVCDDN